MNDKLYNLANRIDDINYEYDTYSYKDSLQDIVGTIDEARKEEVDRIYNDLLEGKTNDYIQFLSDIIEEVDSTLQYKVGKSLEKLIAIKS